MIEGRLSNFDDCTSEVILRGIEESGRVLQEQELDTLIETIARAIDRKRAEGARLSDEMLKQIRVQEQADAYLRTWIEAHTGEPWYCARIVEMANEQPGTFPVQTAGAPGQRIWLRAFLEGWHRKLEAWVLDEARRQAMQYPDTPIDVPEPPANTVEELR